MYDPAVLQLVVVLLPPVRRLVLIHVSDTD
jgi:hypothetical protein